MGSIQNSCMLFLSGVRYPTQSRSHLAPGTPIQIHASKSRTNSPTTPHPVAPTTKSLPRPLDRLRYRSYLSFPLIQDAIRVGLEVIIFFISNFYGLSTRFITWTLFLLYLSFADPFYLYPVTFYTPGSSLRVGIKAAYVSWNSFSEFYDLHSPVQSTTN